jgi:uncharacterized protein (DUF1330 family)
MKWTEERRKQASLRMIGNTNSKKGKIVKESVKKYLSNKYKGEGNPNWKGGRKIDKNGYVLILSPSHPRKRHGSYVAEHRLVVEKYIGRYLEKSEVVHHIDFNTSNNNVSNLMAFNSHSSHNRFEKSRPVYDKEIIFDGRKFSE